MTAVTDRSAALGRTLGRLPTVAPCTDWNGPHDCGLPADHAGDHECAGCGDVWNRGPWDEDPDDWDDDRPDWRCADDPEAAARRDEGWLD